MPALRSERTGRDPEMKHPLELTIVSQYFYPDFGAEGQLMTDLALGLRKMGCEVTVLCTQPSYAFRDRAPRAEVHEGVEIHRVLSTSFDRKGRVGRAINYVTFLVSLLVSTLVQRRSGCLLIVCGAPFLGLVGYVANRLRGRPFILLVLDVFPEAAIRLGYLRPDGLGHRMWDALNRLVIRRAARVVALSDAMKQILMKKVNGAAASEPGKFVVIHNWADPELMRPRPKTENWFATREGLEGVFVVLYSGNMGLSHDLETVIEAAVRLRDRDILFLFIGDGAKKAKLEAMVAQQRLQNVRFLPYQTREVFPYSATCSDVSLVAQESGIEGLAMPSKIYTCLASGRPIVALVEGDSEVARIVNTGRCGRVTSPKDADGLVEAIDHYDRNREAAARDGQNGRAYFEKRFTLTRACLEYHDLLASLTAGPNAGNGIDPEATALVGSARR